MPVTTTASRRHLRSAVRGDVQVLATKTVTFGPLSFDASAPKLWNSLLPALPILETNTDTVLQPVKNSFVLFSLWMRLVTA